ncbi:MAG TPA: hypothetical protein VGH44_06715 [Candidatus Saccharimonadia bacterium]|jgi:hypothetical protein
MRSEPEFPLSARLDQELLRITFCGIVIATFFAALSATHNLGAFLSPTGTGAATTVLGLSAGLGFAYLLSVASALKYQGRRYVDRFPLSAKVSQFFYDASINIFGVYFLVLLVEWIDAHLLHIGRTIYLWPLYLVLFSFTYVVARVVWALAQIAIEYYYDKGGLPWTRS